MQADRWVRRSQYGREGDCDQETIRPQQRRLSSRETATVWAVSRKSEFGRLVKEMNFLSAHQSSSPITPATQYVSTMCRRLTPNIARRSSIGLGDRPRRHSAGTNFLRPRGPALARHGRVEDGRGSLGPMANAPFPIPAHRHGHADFRHPALRLASPRGTRRGS